MDEPRPTPSENDQEQTLAYPVRDDRPSAAGQSTLYAIEFCLYLLAAVIAWRWFVTHNHPLVRAIAFVLLVVWAVSQRVYGRRLYFSAVELRAGWRFLIFLVLTVVFTIVAFVAISRVTQKPRGPLVMTPTLVFLQDIPQFLCVLLAAWIMSLFEKRRLRSYGLGFQGAFGKNFWIGVLWGFVALSLLLLAMYGARDLSLSGPTQGAAVALKFGALWAIAFLIVGFFEEYMFRGYPQFTLTTGMGFWPAAAVMSLLFGFVHSGNPGEAPLGLVSVFIVGMFFALTLYKTGNIWWAIGFHAGWDWGESYFYGTPDSGVPSAGHLLNPSFRAGADKITGGSVGPEGSWLIIPMFVILFVAFNFVYRKRAVYPDPEALKTPAAPTPQPLPAASV